MTKNNRKKAVAQAISTAVALGWVIMQVESAQAATFDNLNYSGAGSLQISTGRLMILDGASVNFGETGDGLAGNITLRADDLLILKPVRKPSAIAGGNINSGAAGTITVTASEVVFLTRVPEPSAIGGIILAGSLAWLAKRKQAAFRKAKV
ncbi:MAG: PEP-CTERM sorting domain-containing protein [Nostoc sp. NMS7]|uniref:PEP-CTERM sorting domain-containing protein n=1 Tax=Nostoc sp. NMS7 TaxID=2815391 RepID=UPI0025DB7F37|nr:PEP-CTERM sorting domain-containing protein [Nostoc sp. NMS7]MBN3949240.1 PEP-CTERM sorting domain-containing protein [Nostoc sp. NMS7]